MNLDGDIVYIGNWKDSKIILLKNILDKTNSNNKLYIYDNFSNSEYNVILQYFKDLKLLDQNLVIIKGNLKDTGLYFYSKNISYLYVNNNVYDSLNLFYFRIPINGYIYIKDNLINDKLLSKFLLENNINTNITRNKINNYYFIQKNKNFVEYPSNNWTTFANFNCNFRYIFKNDILSSAILNNTFYFYKANKNLINQTIKYKNELKNVNIIWGIKLDNNKRRWEYYVYGWNPLYDDDIYSIVRNTNNYFSDYKFTNLLKIFFNNDKSIDYSNCNKLFNDFNKCKIVHAVSFDISEENQTDKTINLYTYSTDVDTTAIPMTTYGYCMNLDDGSIDFASYMYTHKVTDNTFIPFYKKFIEKYNCSFDLVFEKDYYNSSLYVALIDKFKTDEIGIYYHCIDIYNFIHFLKKFKYKKEFIEMVEYNKERFSSFSFEIAINYKIINSEIKNIRTAFYGIF